MDFRLLNSRWYLPLNTFLTKIVPTHPKVCRDGNVPAEAEQHAGCESFCKSVSPLSGALNASRKQLLLGQWK